MVDPVSLILAGDALANTAAKIYTAVHKLLPYTRMKAWKEAGAAIAEVALKNQLKMPEDRQPKFLTLYARFDAVLHELESYYDKDGNSSISFFKRRETAGELHRVGKELRDLALTIRTEGALGAYLCPLFHKQPKNPGERCGICFPKAFAAMGHVSSSLDGGESCPSLVSTASSTASSSVESAVPVNISADHPGRGEHLDHPVNPTNGFSVPAISPPLKRVKQEVTYDGGCGQIDISNYFQVAS
ncbi:hypothetical protein FB451DRAFT_1260096 [Mycena latifolia]|nr:hypothetical protein FB451DRAFT_1260096 [Mycena latifolia]